jgi:serine/threonine protein phosphatase PrpC
VGTLFCEVDGIPLKLEQEGDVDPNACPGCGQADTDGGDGYCSNCGRRLASAAAAESVLKEAEARKVIEANAELAKWLAHPDQPKDASPLAEVAPALPIETVIDLANAMLRIAGALEAARFAWAPEGGDLLVRADRSLELARLRCGRTLAAGESFDARPALAALAQVCLPEPVVHGPTRLVRLLSSALAFSPSGSAAALAATTAPLSLSQARSEIASVRTELGHAPEAAPAPGLGALTDIGLRHSRNEDAFAVERGETHGEPFAALVVCDGVSSASASDKASESAAKTVCSALVRFAEATRTGDGGRALAEAIRKAHEALCAMKFEPEPGKDEPACTVVAALLRPGSVSVGWVGDSRAYLIDPSGVVTQLSRDHSWANEVVQKGEMSEEEAMRSPQAHALTHCLGPAEQSDSGSPPEAGIHKVEVSAGSRILLCSDGLWNDYPKPTDLAEIIRHAEKGEKSAQSLARLLVHHALSKGGRDNVTVVVADALSVEAAAGATPKS